jgi:hypothetical protein
MGGFSGAAGGSILSVVQSIGVIMLPFISDNSLIKRVVRIIFVALIIGSVLICGRSGVLSIIVCLPIAYMSMYSILTPKFLIRISIIILCFIGLLSILFIFINSLPVDDPLSLVLNRTLDTYINLNETGNLQDETTSDLLNNHLIFPNKFSILVLGQPENLINFGVNRTLNSDLGYIRDIWSFGLPGAIIYMFPILWSLYKVFVSHFKNNASKMLIVVSLIYLLFNFKEPYLYVRMLWSIYSIIIACHYINKSSFLKLKSESQVLTD